MDHETNHELRQLTLRGFDPELSQYLLDLARVEGVSVNEAALRLLRKGAGLAAERGIEVVGLSLDHLIGSWTEEEAAEFEQAIADLEQVDEDLWR